MPRAHARPASRHAPAARRRRRLQDPGLQELLPARLIQILCRKVVLTRVSAAVNFPTKHFNINKRGFRVGRSLWCIIILCGLKAADLGLTWPLSVRLHSRTVRTE